MAGMLTLIYVSGAAVMFFKLPSAGWLQKAFLGAYGWKDRREFYRQPVVQLLPKEITIGRDQPGRTFDGYTLCTFVPATGASSQVVLLDMSGKIVHRWDIPFSKVWPDPVHLGGPMADSEVCIFGCHLYANGDLLVVYHAGLNRLPHGGGLARIDKHSHVIWKYDGKTHHHVSVGDDGTIYAIQNDLVCKMPEGLERIAVPALLDALVMLSPDGELLSEPIGLLEVLHNSPYAALLTTAMTAKSPQEGASELPREDLPPDGYQQDVLHTNFVNVGTPKLAEKFPRFQAGQVLVSMRELDTLMVLDPRSRSVVWASRGPWRRQHHGELLDNGHLLIFDNLGSPLGSRVLEYDPETDAIPWSYPDPSGEQFFNIQRGYCQRLPNGNTLIVNSQTMNTIGGDIREVTPAGEIVWQCNFPAILHLARRYGPQELQFFKAGQRPRT
jgi:hypothetical protein